MRRAFMFLSTDSVNPSPQILHHIALLYRALQATDGQGRRWRYWWQYTFTLMVATQRYFYWKMYFPILLLAFKGKHLKAPQNITEMLVFNKLERTHRAQVRSYGTQSCTFKLWAPLALNSREFPRSVLEVHSQYQFLKLNTFFKDAVSPNCFAYHFILLLFIFYNLTFLIVVS